jgi:hypothetical protein
VEKFIFSTKNDTIKKGSLLWRWIHGVFRCYRLLIGCYLKKITSFSKLVNGLSSSPFYYVEKLLLRWIPSTVNRWLFITAPSLLMDKKQSLFYYVEKLLLGVSDSFGFNPFFIMPKNSLFRVCNSCNFKGVRGCF